MMKDNPYFSITGNLIRRFSYILTKLLVLNFLTLIFCIPIVTIGAALTAMHGCLIKIIRRTDVQLGKEFFQMFRSNLKQATLLWLPFLLIFSAAQINALILLVAPDILPGWVVVPAVSAAILAVSYFPKAVLMVLLWAVPVVLFGKFTLSWPLILMFGLSLPGYLCTKLYDQIFLALEENQDEAV